jgi:hypothetical protein
MAPRVTQGLGPAEIRRRFNEGRYVQRAAAGELRVVVKADRHPSQPKAREPHCTRSQIVSYFDHLGNELARAHRYLRKDGTLGASGKPDPKSLMDGNTLYVCIDDLDVRR